MRHRASRREDAESVLERRAACSLSIVQISVSGDGGKESDVPAARIHPQGRPSDVTAAAVDIVADNMNTACAHSALSSEVQGQDGGGAGIKNDGRERRTVLHQIAARNARQGCGDGCGARRSRRLTRSSLREGGRGGRGKPRFSIRRTVRRRFANLANQAEAGFLVAARDVRLVGYPNVSSRNLITADSAAHLSCRLLRPRAVLGVVQTDYEEFRHGGHPGLIEGAADGAGLGRLLRHVDARHLHLVDASGIEGAIQRICRRAQSTVRKIASQILVANKMVLPEVAREFALEAWLRTFASSVQRLRVSLKTHRLCGETLETLRKSRRRGGRRCASTMRRETARGRRDDHAQRPPFLRLERALKNKSP